jgi:hypothetical protein
MRTTEEEAKVPILPVAAGRPRARIPAGACVLLVSIALALLVLELIWWLDESELPTAANFVFVILIGIATGATELLARFRDRPFDAVVSLPGLFYLGINGAAGALALHIIMGWGVVADDPVQRVFVAGLGAMAVFRSGLFTARVGTKDIAFGPNLVLQVILDVLDRTYDRQRAVRRAELIGELMGGVGFAQAKANLSEVCFNLLQNMRPEERETFSQEIERIDQIEGLSDDAKAMALGLKLMGIVGEDTLRTAGQNLGSTIFGYQTLSAGLARELARPSPEDVVSELLTICRGIAHKRAQPDVRTMKEIEDAITRTESLAPTVRATLVVFAARRQFGDSVVEAALKLMPNKPEPAIPDAPPPPPPSPTPAPTPTPELTPAPAEEPDEPEPEEPDEPGQPDEPGKPDED